jgi:hypothetical protein
MVPSTSVERRRSNSNADDGFRGPAMRVERTRPFTNAPRTVRRRGRVDPPQQSDGSPVLNLRGDDACIFSTFATLLTTAPELVARLHPTPPRHFARSKAYTAHGHRRGMRLPSSATVAERSRASATSRDFLASGQRYPPEWLSNTRRRCGCDGLPTSTRRFR